MAAYKTHCPASSLPNSHLLSSNFKPSHISKQRTVRQVGSAPIACPKVQISMTEVSLKSCPEPYSSAFSSKIPRAKSS
ncbi:unnamed protein product [Cuscuta campestris]|uniref:Uncharacterized protein n=1 Tax=Cuscuta campestris TaxID=132261 RepID=A0A484MPX1_9ASTE|nr:unnamed protein product [Cuscuta campestris]